MRDLDTLVLAPDRGVNKVLYERMKHLQSYTVHPPSVSDETTNVVSGSEVVPRWFFERRGRLGGASGETVPNAVAASGLDLEDLLVREAIQNSCDAAAPVAGAGGEREEVRLIFRKRTYRGDTMDRLVDGLQLEQLHRRAWVVDGELSESYDRWLDDLRELPVLFVEDYGTTGLGGRLDRPDEGSHFAKFVYDFGFQGKVQDKEISGGSYGLGKGAHARASQLRCILLHTVIQPFESQGELALDGDIGENHWARFQGVCHFPLHETDGQLWTGRGFFGQARPNWADPLANEAAELMANRLDFPARKATDRGTTIAILGCNASLIQLQRAVEDWWWPRLFQQTLEVELIDEDVDGNQQFYPRPLQRPELVPFIRCFDTASGDFFRNSNELSSPELKPIHGSTAKREGSQNINDATLHPGRLVMTPLPLSTRDDEGRKNMFVDAIALIRGSRMVVAYRPYGPRGNPVAATYISSKALDHTLLLSEPITHNDWDPSSARLLDSGRELVANLLKQLDRNIRRFQTSLLPSADNSSERAIPLERSIGFLLSGERKRSELLTQARTSNKVTNGYPIHIRFVTNEPQAMADGSCVTYGDLIFKWLGIADDLKQIRIIMQAASVASDRLVRMDAIPVVVWREDSTDHINSRMTADLNINLKAGQNQLIRIRIGPHPTGVRLRLFTSGEEITP